MRRFFLGLALCLGVTELAAAAPTSPPSKAGSTRVIDGSARRHVAGGPTNDDLKAGAESPELAQLREAERDAFLPAMGPPGTVLPPELSVHDPRDSRGLPPAASEDTIQKPVVRAAWMTNLVMPDLPVRWDARLVRYLEFLKTDARGRSLFSALYKRSGRYRNQIQSIFRRKNLPEDLLFVAMNESAFSPTIRSHAGASGMWQFMPDAAKSYGLAVDRWLDQRFNFVLSTEAAADYLADLHRRFGTWELTMAAYDMGYGGMSAVIRRYNTNDYWALSHIEGALPWESVMYVPKTVAFAIASRNLEAFGFADVKTDAPIAFDEVSVPAGVALSTVALAASVPANDVVALNPELRAQRTPPVLAAEYKVKVPIGKAKECATNLATARAHEPVEVYAVRFGESIDDVAEMHGTTTAKLVALNAIKPAEVIRGGAALLVPKGSLQKKVTQGRLRVIVPAQDFESKEKERVYYRVTVGDTVDDVAQALGITVDDLGLWNDLDPDARLISGMTLQAFVDKGHDLEAIRIYKSDEVELVPVGSEAFFTYLEKEKHFKRIVIVAKAGDTLESIGTRYRVPVKTMERVNQKNRREKLEQGEKVVVYLPGTSPPAAPTRAVAQQRPNAPQGRAR